MSINVSAVISDLAIMASDSNEIKEKARAVQNGVAGKQLGADTKAELLEESKALILNALAAGERVKTELGA